MNTIGFERDPWRLNLRHLRVLAMTTKLGSLSAVAKAIHLSQPATTQAINRLEDQLDMVLFERRPTGMHATEFALAFSPRITSALSYIGSPRVTGTQVRAFLSLVHCGSYIGASTALGLSQPSVHRTISDLEISMGMKLVERRGRGIAITDKGMGLARRLRLARRELRAGLSELSALRGAEIGHITIGAMPLSRARFLPQVLVQFHNQHPNIQVRIVEGSYMDMVEPLRDGDIDVLLGAMRMDRSVRDLTQTPVFSDTPYIFARADHPLVGKGLEAGKFGLRELGRAEVKKLARYKWFVPEEGVPLHTKWAKLFSDYDIERPETPILCGSVMMIRQLLLNTDGLTLLSPEQLKVELEAGWVKQICKCPDWMQRNIGVITRADWRPTKAQNTLLSIMSELGSG